MEGFQRSVYHAKDSSVEWRPFRFGPNSIDQYRYLMGDSLIEPWHPEQRRGFRLAGLEGDRWVITADGGYYGSSTLEAASAIWFFSRGEIARLDRQVLAELARRAAGEN